MSIVPAEGATAIAINGSISATFSEPMVTSFGATTFTVKPAAGGAAISGTVAFSGNTATFTPSSNLDAGITYTATITTAAKDAAGNPLAADKAWNFTTGAVEDKTAPTVSSTTPSDLATGIALSPVLTATFSEAMTASTSTSIYTLAPTAGGPAIAGTVSLSGTTATFTPSSSLTGDTLYTVTVTTGVKDAAGNFLAENKTWCFRTAAAVVGGAYTGSYLFYKGVTSGNNNSWSLSAVDPAHPGNAITVEAGTDVNSKLGFNTGVETATYEPATKTFSNIRDYAIVYAKSDGKFYRVSALKNGGIGAPTRVSNEIAANTICYPDYQYVAPDFANPENSQFVYRTPGPDSTCGNDDDVFKMVRLDMSASEAPITAKRSVKSLVNWSTGGIAGWLVNDAGNLKRCDSNFANCSASIKSIGGAATHRGAEAETLNRLLLPIGSTLFVYNADANLLPEPILARCK